MSEMGRINGVLASQPLLRPQSVERPVGLGRVPERPEDRAEISWLADALARARALPDIREEKVALVRAAIERGDYETPDKIDVVVEGLMEDLGL